MDPDYNGHLLYLEQFSKLTHTISAQANLSQGTRYTQPRIFPHSLLIFISELAKVLSTSLLDQVSLVIPEPETDFDPQISMGL